jgi:hypothetical protein
MEIKCKSRNMKSPLEVVRQFESKMTSDEIIEWNTLIRDGAPFTKLNGFANKIVNKYQSKKL